MVHQSPTVFKVNALSSKRNFVEAVENAVRYDNDTDTTAAVTGGLAGLIYGLEGIPASWRENKGTMQLKDVSPRPYSKDSELNKLLAASMREFALCSWKYLQSLWTKHRLHSGSLPQTGGLSKYPVKPK